MLAPFHSFSCKRHCVAGREFRDKLNRRAKQAGISLEKPLVEGLETYYQLLTKWNAKINLTAFRLTPEGDDAAVDRLLIEPVVAARYVPENARTLLDAGSGGGSPAIPLKLARPMLDLTMVESKARKAAFLREVVRELGLANAFVETSRFEELASRPGSEASTGLLTIRAVRLEPKLVKSMKRLLQSGGRVMTFQPSPDAQSLNGFETLTSTALVLSPSRPAYLVSYQRSSLG